MRFGGWLTGLLFGLLVAAFAVWSVLVIGLGAADALDGRLVPPWLEPRSAAGQVLEGFALATHPAIMFAIVAAYAGWAYQRRLRRLSLAILSTIPAGWGGYVVLKQAFGRPRPVSQVADALSWANYPRGGGKGKKHKPVPRPADGRAQAEKDERTQAQAAAWLARQQQHTPE